ncbi:anthranilate synthase component I family protein [Metabacillus halosaccharovorans]|uniref:Anthranilate synthase component I family protein n=1 Tax=Metabacillus halosaccharovorans TaxID=930124 RepID=A0ABT3DCH6_9BACI|nr:anthranilate synthase component I family protein [Metabacillus halosaccharovorans]MCV9884657.1 anthranilate synthase component I family protein [Metabacillus halosaccharovorans]
MQQRRTSLSVHFDYTLDFFSQYQYLSKDEDKHAFLESGRGGRYSIAGVKPFATVKGKGEQLVITKDNEMTVLEGKPLDLFKDWFKQYYTSSDPDLPDFQGGAIGFISYDCVRHFETLPEIAIDDLETPDLYFLLFDDIAIYDHHTSKLWLITHYYQEDQIQKAHEKLKQMKEKWTSVQKVAIKNDLKQVKSTDPIIFTEDAFKRAVESIKDYIGQGDVFQVNLSLRQHFQLENHPLKIYEALRKVNPSPYMAYLQFPDLQIVSGSPELLVKKKESLVSTRPIAGTRSRGKNEQEDIRLANELIHNEKERAEHVMLVDLERNDLGRVCEYGSVHVNEFMVIEKYSHVMHIVSNVQGTMKKDANYADIIKATFPGGTITGAPKVRTMEIIEELEPTRRGIYTGSIGWIGYDEDMELNIVIRTMVAKDGYGYVQSGAGIVIDSNPDYEYKEALKKAKALVKAIELSKEEKILG